MNKLTNIPYKILNPLYLFLKQKAKAIYIPGFQKINVYQVVRFIYNQLNTIGLYDRASAISFNLIMALPAGFLFLFSIQTINNRSIKTILLLSYYIIF